MNSASGNSDFQGSHGLLPVLRIEILRQCMVRDALSRVMDIAAEIVRGNGCYNGPMLDSDSKLSGKRASVIETSSFQISGHNHGH